MTISARDIDHLSLTLTDPDSAAVSLQQLGFTVTPEGVEPRCICFQPDQDDVPNYVELLQGDPTGTALALNVVDLEGEERAHTWETNDGFEIDAEVVVGEGGGPLPWFPVRHETPDAFMEPEWIVHPNGALGLIAIHAVAENPRELAKTLKTEWSARTEEIFDGCMLVKTGTVELLVWSAEAYQAEYKALEVMAPDALPAVVGITIAVERARPLQALLRANNVAFAVAEGDRVLVASDKSAGLMIEFVPQA
ncbi:MAG: VOC family protein [Reyranellaceae bacterium]